MKYLEFVKTVANGSDVSLKNTKTIIDATMATIRKVVSEGDEVSFPEFGKFKQKVRAARKGVNPITREAIDIPESRDLVFKASSSVKKDLND